jgi:GMP synthase (glutamine-hydrolysing)
MSVARAGSGAKPLLVVKCGSTLPALREARGDYEDWILAGMGVARDEARVAAVAEGEDLPAPQEIAAVVLTGSSAMVSERAPWSERTAAWLRGAVAGGLPVLGICYGHQLLAHALGGRVARNPRGREIGCVDVETLPAARGDALLGALPERLCVHATHVESVLELPAGARLLAASQQDAHQAFAIAKRVWGVQFHPEFDAGVIRGYLEARRELLAREGLDAEALLARVRESDDGRALLRRFAVIAGW